MAAAAVQFFESIDCIDEDGEVTLEEFTKACKLGQARFGGGGGGGGGDGAGGGPETVEKGEKQGETVAEQPDADI